MDTWGKGRRMIEKSEIREYKGYRYITARMPIGHVCGYVEIPEGHYLFGKDYSDPVPELKPFMDELYESSCGKRSNLSILAYAFSSKEKNQDISAEIFFDVHGSLTFGGCLQFYDEPDIIFEWAMGFDTAHFDDTPRTQTHEFCEKECRSFIDQLVEMDEKLKGNKEINT
jgi:hypothetical protein